MDSAENGPASNEAVREAISTEVELPALLPSAEYDAETALADREKKWGFTLDELRNASKVVRTLFLKPSLFIGDPYLSDSRLYTMITRDRQKKREHRLTYKAIMNEEKSRKKRYMRSQNQAALGLTIMKREREEALGALLLEGNPAADSPLLLKGSANDDDDDEASGVANQADQDAAKRDAECVLSETEKHHLRLLGAFENLLRLERCLAGVEYFESAQTASQRFAYDEEDESKTKPDPTLVTGKAPTAGRLWGSVDWGAASQLTAQVYRYSPHVFGSQMPPPLFGGPIPPNTSEKDRLQYIRGFKLHLARQVAAMLQQPSDEAGASKRARAEGLQNGEKSSFALLSEAFDSLAASGDRGWEVVVTIAPAGETEVKPDTSVGENLTSVLRLREYFSSPSSSQRVIFDGQFSQATFRLAPAAALLGAIEAAFVSGNSVSADFWAPTSHESLEDSVVSASAESSLNLFLARHLYGNQRLLEFGPSPIVVDREPPTSESEEPDVWNVFDELQLYATDHYDGDGLQLTNWRGCNICKIRFNRLHPYYYSMCHLCGEFNYNKRLVTRDLRGKVVLLTGCRIKIGFAMALSLLRCGATVLGTTRFAHEAVARFQQESDYHSWKERLHLYSLDMRDLWVVTQFCGFVRKHFPKLFAIVNNAAQTIARTPQYTEHLRQIEISPSPELRDAIKNDGSADEWNRFFLRHTSVTVGEALSIEHQPAAQPFLPIDNGGASTTALTHGAEVASETVAPCTESSAMVAGAVTVASAKPTGIIDHAPKHGDGSFGTTLVFDRYDTQAEESDHRETNSWVMKLGEVEGSEAAEVMAINALAPFIMNSKLKPCLTNREGDATRNEARFIINVSAMEGQFYRFKQTTHPHTNMAKAALNMMTRTSADDYAQDGIYMNSVDTGWITDESPKMKKERRADQYMLCPLDEVDAAARCLDLMYTDSEVHGHFYKDFKSIPW